MQFVAYRLTMEIPPIATPNGLMGIIYALKPCSDKAIKAVFSGNQFSVYLDIKDIPNNPTKTLLFELYEYLGIAYKQFSPTLESYRIYIE